MATAQTNNILTPELRFEFKKLGEAVVIHRLTKFESRAIREAAFEWLRELEEERDQARLRNQQRERVRERRWIAIAVAVLGVVHIMAGIAIAWH